MEEAIVEAVHSEILLSERKEASLNSQKPRMHQMRSNLKLRMHQTRSKRKLRMHQMRPQLRKWESKSDFALQIKRRLKSFLKRRVKRFLNKQKSMTNQPI